MSRHTIYLTLILMLGLSCAALAGDRLIPAEGHDSVLHSGSLDTGRKASRDTIRLIGPWGSGAVVNGQFQGQAGEPSWNGWTSVDKTARNESAWHVDTYNVVSGVYSAWCGELSFAACDPADEMGGYGSNYSDYLSWYGTVADPALPSTVTIDATVNHNTEPGYDYSNLGFSKDGESPVYLWTADGQGSQVAIQESVTYLPGEYIGEFGDQIRITWHVTSDAVYDDSDCSFFSDGALQIDDISITMSNGVVESSAYDFEDGTLGDWIVEFQPGVGDYAHLRTQLADEDPCAGNYSPAACFIADDFMEAERGLPVAYCQDWCYGPGGYIVNTQGGQLGPEFGIHNAIRSPIIPWPADVSRGSSYEFDVYRHEDLSANAPGIFYTWGIRSTSSTDPADIESARFEDRNLVYYGQPKWLRGGDSSVGDLIVEDPRFVQVELAVYEPKWLWTGWDGDDGYPAPYFDNVALSCYDQQGPEIDAHETKLAQDSFPADGLVHVDEEIGLNDVRFDMASNISLATDLRNDPGDSIVATIHAVRIGSELVVEDIDANITAPRLHFRMKPNHTFDETRRRGAGPFTVNPGQAGELQGVITSVSTSMIEGWVRGAPARTGGFVSDEEWMFDLPDVDFLYPGDILHYYIEAWDAKDGDYQRATLPADLYGYDDLNGAVNSPSAYHSSFVVRGLPSLADSWGYQPKILLWNDFGNRGGENEWHNSLGALGYWTGSNFDVYYTNGPTSGVGNGLGGRATSAQLAGYEVILYTAGNLGAMTITNLDFENDAGDDIGVLTEWLEQGDKFLFATGDNLVTDLSQSGSAASEFVDTWLGVELVASDARPLLGGYTVPSVYPLNYNSVFQTTEEWLAFGGCPELNTFDAIHANGSEVLAEFNDGSSGLAAAVKNNAANGSAVLLLPYDLMYIRTPVYRSGKINQPGAFAARTEVLKEVLYSSGIPISIWDPAGNEAPGARFGAQAYPNPFNPVTRIDYHLPLAGYLELKVFSVRGQLVRTLVSEMKAAGPGHVMWDGTNNQGGRVSSGVYFYEARSGDQVQVDKITLVK